MKTITTRTKAIAALTLAAMIALSMAACAAPAGTAATPDMELEDVLAQMYDGADLDAQVKDWLNSGLYTTEVTTDNEQYMTGVTGLDYQRAIASEPLISAQAFSVVLIRMNDGADIEAAKSAIRENADPRKWICVGVEESDVVVDNLGNLIVLIMADNAAAYQEAFLAIGQ